ncbi:atherin-like isoform X2 [Mustela erminea]|uniref:atherin-like isoform X2 n=1 Tax=Mustela erminea TaxID=36723 RepID=UPI0013871CF1|nr:atherin-like isoform X2 [Mustela erminea]
MARNAEGSRYLLSPRHRLQEGPRTRPHASPAAPRADLRSAAIALAAPPRPQRGPPPPSPPPAAPGPRQRKRAEAGPGGRGLNDGPAAGCLSVWMLVHHPWKSLLSLSVIPL